MMKVGTKQLKNQLSRYLQRARAGEIVRVTDRGRVIAEVRGVAANDAADHDQAMRELEAVGLVAAGSGKFRSFRPVRLRGRVLASRAITEDRG